MQASITRDPVLRIDTVTSAILDFEGGVATFTCSTRAESDQRVDIYGTEGRISIEIPFNIPPDRPTRIFVIAGGDPPVAPATETLTFDTADPYACEADRFADAVLDGVPLPVEPEDAVANMRVIEAIFAAALRAGTGPVRDTAVPSPPLGCDPAAARPRHGGEPEEMTRDRWARGRAGSGLARGIGPNDPP